MRAYDIIAKKKNNEELTSEEIHYFIRGYLNDKIKDYQVSAWLMAICLNGMTDDETVFLTKEILESGDTVDLSGIEGIKVDKHSTGGVGDKTTLIVAPLVASLGLKVAKMSGRGLGHTGGTIDKLESIPGFRVNLTKEEFFEVVNETGMSIISQTGNIAPADKKLYALRDVTATVDSIPLIASSIMGKKLASGADSILLDVKVGSGAFMKSLDDARKLAGIMVKIGSLFGKNMVAMLTDMDSPLGNNIGNSLEVIEAVETLRGEGPNDLTEICVELASHLVAISTNYSLEEARSMLQENIKNGKALQIFKNFCKAQGGNIDVIEDTAKFSQAKIIYEVRAQESGIINHIDAEGCGIASMLLGAGRQSKEDAIDYSAGIKLLKKKGKSVLSGECIALFYTNDERLIMAAEERFLNSVSICPEPPESIPAIMDILYQADLQ